MPDDPNTTTATAVAPDPATTVVVPDPALTPATETAAAPGPTTTNQDYQQLTNKINELQASLISSPTPEQNDSLYEKFEEDTGIPKKSAQWFMTAIPQMIDQAYRQRSLVDKQGRRIALDIVGKENPTLLSDIEELMEAQPAGARQNPEVWKNAAYIALGKNAKNNPHQVNQTPPTPLVPPVVPANNQNNQRIVGGNVEGLSRPAAPAAQSIGGKTYDANERQMINRYFKGDEKAYELHKNEKTISKIKPEKEAK